MLFAIFVENGKIIGGGSGAGPVVRFVELRNLLHALILDRPKVRPATMCCWTTAKMMRAGTSVMIAIAAIVPHSVPVVVTEEQPANH
jgi:hypothetical protein